MSRSFWCLVVMAVAAASGCGLRTRELIRPDDPNNGAFGYVTLGRSEAGHTPIEVSVYGLPSSPSFVVWLVPHAGGEAKRLGPLDLSAEPDVILLHGFLRADAPPHPSELDVVVTAERDPGATAPSGQRVLWASLDLP